MPELEAAESLVVWAFRRWALAWRANAGDLCALVWNEFMRQFGRKEGPIALATFAQLVGEIAEHRRRTIRLHMPCSPYLGPDEVWLICFLGSCQRGEARLAVTLAEWLVEPQGVGTLIQKGTSTARIMTAHGFEFPNRTGEAGRPAPRGESLM